MAVSGFLKMAGLGFLAKDSSDRQLHRIIKKQRTLRLVEFGIESIEKTNELLALAAKYSPDATIEYTGFDLFDQRPEELPSLSLIEAHRTLAKSGASFRLSPGPISSGVINFANALADTDLMLIASGTSDEELSSTWFYFPRMCHPGTEVLKRKVNFDPKSDSEAWQTISLEEIDHRASLSGSRIAA